MSVGHPFVVHVARLRRAPGTRQREQRQGTIEGLDCSGSAVPEGATPVADVVLEAVLGGVSVIGTVLGRGVAPCRRCLVPASGPLHLAVRELYPDEGNPELTSPLVADVIALEPLL